MIAERPVADTADATTVAPEKGEAARLGRVIYERVRAQYDTPENKGKCLIVEVDTGECELIDDALLARRLYELEPSTRRYLVRVGHASFFRYRSPRMRRIR